jgi:hypothetical protein
MYFHHSQECAFGKKTENLKETDPLGDLVVAGMIMLKCILRKQVLKMWTGFI